MDSSDETIIELSKKKILLGLLGASAFVAAGIWMFTLDEANILSERSYRLFFNNPTYVYGLGLVSIVLFGLLALFFFKKLFDKKPGLIFSASGIVDNASAVSAGFISWSELIGSELFEMQGQKMLIIMVRDPQKYVDRGNAVKRTLNQANYKMCGSPIVISSNALKVNFSELRSLFDQYQRKYGDASQ
jgi:hypothetical protein